MTAHLSGGNYKPHCHYSYLQGIQDIQQYYRVIPYDRDTFPQTRIKKQMASDTDMRTPLLCSDTATPLPPIHGSHIFIHYHSPISLSLNLSTTILTGKEKKMRSSIRPNMFTPPYPPQNNGQKNTKKKRPILFIEKRKKKKNIRS